MDYNSMHPCRGKFTGPAAFLHEVAREEKHLQYVRELGGKVPRLPFRGIIQSSLWFLVVICQSVRCFFKPQRDLNRCRIRNLWDIPRMVAYGLRFNASPNYYYEYLLHTGDASAEEISRYQLAWEHHFIGRRIARIRNSDVGALDNKDRFAEFCQKNGLPTIPALKPGDEELEPRDLFAKSALGYGGIGCVLLPYDLSRKGWKLEESILTEEAIDPVLSGKLGTDRYILQYREYNHPDMRWLSKDVLSTLRIVTAWDPNGQPVSLRATIRIPGTESAILDNSTQGGLCAPVNPRDGTITGYAVPYTSGYRTNHPLTSEKSFIGFQIPLWQEALDLVHHAHRIADNYNFLGWDVAITERGPLLTECNVWSHIDLVQVAQEAPFLTDEVLACYRAEPALQDCPADSVG